MGVRVNTRELEKFQKDLQMLGGQQKEQFFEHATRQCAARFLNLVIPATPVGDSQTDEDGKTIHVGGALRRGWTCRTEKQAENGAGKDVDSYVAGHKLVGHKRGYEYGMELTNPMHYASYVEYGHRQEPGRFVPALGKRLVNDHVDGLFFVKQSEEAFESVAPTVVQGLLDNYLKQVF